MPEQDGALPQTAFVGAKQQNALASMRGDDSLPPPLPLPADHVADPNREIPPKCHIDPIYLPLYQALPEEAFKSENPT